MGYGLRSVNYLPPVADDDHDIDEAVDDSALRSLKQHQQRHGSKRRISIPEGVDPKSEDYQVDRC